MPEDFWYLELLFVLKKTKKKYIKKKRKRIEHISLSFNKVVGSIGAWVEIWKMIDSISCEHYTLKQ